MSNVAAVRVASSGFPDVGIVAVTNSVFGHPSYAAAKAGNVVEAEKLVASVMAEFVGEFISALAGRRPVLVGVAAVEGHGVNVIPQAMVDAIAAGSGLSAWKEISQANYAGHTKASGWHRLANQAVFDGPVTPGTKYWLLPRRWQS